MLGTAQSAAQNCLLPSMRNARNLRTYPQEFLGWDNILLQHFQDSNHILGRLLFSDCLLQSFQLSINLFGVHNGRFNPGRVLWRNPESLEDAGFAGRFEPSTVVVAGDSRLNWKRLTWGKTRIEEKVEDVDCLPESLKSSLVVYRSSSAYRTH
jgi:hypothetical protein